MPTRTQFAAQAKAAWTSLSPTATAALPDPDTFFDELGQSAEDAWADLWPTLVGPDTPGEDTMHKIGRIKAAQAAAAEIIAADYLQPSPDHIEDPDDEPDQLAQALHEGREAVRDDDYDGPDLSVGVLMPDAVDPRIELL